MKKALLKCIAASVAALTLLGAVTVIILKSPKKKSSFTESEETTVTALYTITDYNGKDSIMLVVMNDKNNYVVTVDGEKAVFNERSKGTFEIKLPSDKKRVKIEIQLV